MTEVSFFFRIFICKELADITFKIQEIFGPVLSVFVYDDADVESMLSSVKDLTPYGLTGAVFSQDK